MIACSFSANWGSWLTLNVRAKCGFRPCRRQIRRTLFSLRPTAWAMLRVLQWVALRGFSWVVFHITSWILAGVIVGVLPGRGASLSSAAQPPSRNRFRQRAAFSGMIFNLAAICLSCIPAAASKTIRARSTLRAAALRARARDSSIFRCSALSPTGRATRIVFAPSIVKTMHRRYSLLLRPHYTSSGGIQWPHEITRERNGEKIYQIFADSVTIDQDLTDDL